MDYFVVGADGAEYGPAKIDVLKAWVADSRVTRDSDLKEFQSGRVIKAGALAELFPPSASPPPPVTMNYQHPPVSYPRNNPIPVKSSMGDGGSDVIWAIVRSALAIVLFFVFKGLGVIVGAYGLVYAIRGYQKGHRLGIVAIVISAVALVVIGIGWALRLTTHSV